ncbi:hypothetical protein GOP47_0002198 [Adiantum capillus-veneris]|uniref:Auxin response factor n=1 Tax=Adiantum capillus-veneris TaxID=13818 RepID=A0A9D4V9Q7_ADICA|nr:hypothetical protein GOP47_0002198 [Adiantum capillus-veneris]
MAETSSGSPPVDTELWHACAGALAHLPQVGSSVVYFPQGHAEQVSPRPFLDLPPFPPAIACKVTCVDFLADPETDEAYARMRLQPLPHPFHDAGDNDHSDSPLLCHESKPVSFAKTLTQSDANNGGGFSIPRYCAETILPRLDYAQTPPVQTVLARDIHGTVWKFRHIYRGTPRRHLLTTGWSNFVNQKKLVAGDVIVFMRGNSGELCIGIRRSMRGVGHHRLVPSRCGIKVGADQDLLIPDLCKAPDLSMAAGSNCSNFSRHRTPFTMQSVVEAATAASSGQSFEIVYYPRASAAEFCVKSHLVRKSLQRSWAPGMRFKMAVDTDDASRTSWYMGTIMTVEEVDPVCWPMSPWKILQVTWDEGVLQGIERVSPWQVDLVSPMLLPPLSLPRKKLRLLHPRELQLDGGGHEVSPLISSSTPVYPHPSYEFQVTGLYPSMEGARHGSNDGLAAQDFAFNNQLGWVHNNLYQPQIQHLGASGLASSLGLGTSFVEAAGADNQLIALTVGSSSSSEPALSSNLSCCDEGGSSSPKCTQFVLFGKAIDVQPTNEHLQLLSHATVADGLTMSDGPQSEVSLSAQGSSIETLENAGLHLQQGDSLCLTYMSANADPQSS